MDFGDGLDRRFPGFRTTCDWVGGAAETNDDGKRGYVMNTTKQGLWSARALVLCACLMGVTPLQAATAVCTGAVTAFASHVPGGVYVGVAEAPLMRVCVPGTTLFRTNSDNCKHYIAMLTLAFAMNKSVSIYIDNAPGESCASIPPWYDADVRFIYVYN